MQPSATEPERNEAVNHNFGSDLVEAIVAYAGKNRISRRQISLMTGLSRARVQRILCSNPEARYEARTSELNRIVKAIGMNQYDAFVSSEISHILEENPNILDLIPFLSNVLDGLVVEIASEIQATDGIELSSCRIIHAQIMRRRIVKLVVNELHRYFARREALRADMEHGSVRVTASLYE